LVGASHRHHPSNSSVDLLIHHDAGVVGQGFHIDQINGAFGNTLDVAGLLGGNCRQGRPAIRFGDSECRLLRHEKAHIGDAIVDDNDFAVVGMPGESMANNILVSSTVTIRRARHDAVMKRGVHGSVATFLPARTSRTNWCRRHIFFAAQEKLEYKSVSPECSIAPLLL